jgi:hypothetical protein
MGHHFAVLVAEGAFVIDQTVTVAFAGLEQRQAALEAELAPVLDRYGGTAGLLREEAGGGRPDRVHRQRDDLTGGRPAGGLRPSAGTAAMPPGWLDTRYA